MQNYLDVVIDEADGQKSSISVQVSGGSKYHNEIPNILDEIIVIGERHVLLRGIVEMLAEFHPGSHGSGFSAEHQTAIGQRLFDICFGHVPREVIDILLGQSLHLRIWSDVPEVRRIPWPLLHAKHCYCFERDWWVSLNYPNLEGERRQKIVTPETLRMLIIVPDEIPDYQATNSKSHLEALIAILRPASVRTEEVETWQEFTAATQKHHFDILYYYGHGDLYEDTVELVFKHPDKGADPRVAADIRLALTDMHGGPPLLAYINCCYGSTANYSGVGASLISICPAVLTNRTVAAQTAARKQAESFFKSFVIKRQSPDAAYAEVVRSSVEMGMSLAQMHWMAPIMHINYEHWEPSHETKTTPDWNTPTEDWRLFIDREPLISGYKSMLDSLNDEAPKHSAIFTTAWREGDGLRYFQDRLNEEIKLAKDDYGRENFRLAGVVNLEFPLDSGSEMSVVGFERILSNFFSGPSGKIHREIASNTDLHSSVPAIVVISIPLDETFSPVILSAFLEWWTWERKKYLPNHFRAVFIVSLQCEAGDPTKILPRFMTDAQLYKVRKASGFFGKIFGQNDKYEVSGEGFPAFAIAESHAMMPLTLEELTTFVLEYAPVFQLQKQIPLPPNIESYLTWVVDQSSGEYEKVVGHLDGFGSKVADHMLRQNQSGKAQ